MRYPKLGNGSAVTMNPKTDLWDVACCDCGLIHCIKVRIISDTEVTITFKERKRATAQLRRHNWGSLQQGKNKKYEMLRR